VSTLSSNLGSVRYLGFSDFHSVNSLQNSSYVWSFGKSNRFAYGKPHTESFYNVSASVCNRSTTMGYGNKYELKNLQGRNSPPPNSYNFKSQFESNVDKKRGISLHERIPYVVFYI